MSNLTINTNENPVHRALIFQGGGALGAYEAGIFRVLHDKLIDKAEEENRPLFDIVAGTSAGAINAVLLVNYVLKHQDKSNPWRGSADELCQFWEDVATSTWYLDNPFIHASQDAAHFFREQSNKIWKPSLELFDKNTNYIREKWPLNYNYYLWPDKLGDLATGESFRRYWSWYQFAYSPLGTHNVLSPSIIQPDFKFFNPFNYMLKYDNTPITETIRKYWNDEKNPIITDEGQPRLLIVAVDVQDATTVTFDSYINKKYQQRMSIYGDEDRIPHVIEYKDGIKMEHLLATMSSHLRYKFPELKVTTLENEQIKKGAPPRPFMDGFYLSNTPLREVIQAHKKYWEEKDIEKLKDDVPSLDIIIGDLYPTIEKGTPEDPDSIQNRVQNVLYHDKSKYDEKAAIIVSDYIGISKILWNHLKDKDMSEEELKIIKKEINCIIKSKGRKGTLRKFEDLIYNRFTINNLLRIEYGNGQQLNDSNDINGKAFEFSSRTIRDLIKQGCEDTLKYETELSHLL